MVGEKRAQLSPPDRELTVSPPLACLDSPLHSFTAHISDVTRQSRTSRERTPCQLQMTKGTNTQKREGRDKCRKEDDCFLFFRFPSFPSWRDFVKEHKSQILNKCVCKKRGAVQRLFMRCLLSHHRLLLARYQNTGAKNCLSTSLFILSQTGTGKQMKSLSKWKQRGY